MDTTAEISMRGSERCEWMRQRLMAVSIELRQMHGDVFADAFLEDVGAGRSEIPVFGVVERSLDKLRGTCFISKFSRTSSTLEQCRKCLNGSALARHRLVELGNHPASPYIGLTHS